MKKYTLLQLGFWLFGLLSVIQAQAQQQAMFTQYMFNGLAINPAYAGSHGGLSLTALGRKQWMGLEGAPSTQTLTAHSSLRQEKIGVGLMLLHDKIGVTNQTGIYGSYAYRLQVRERAILSMGLQAGVNYFNSRFTEVSTTDPTFAGQDVREWQPNFGFGLYYYTDRFYVGASAPQLNENVFTKRGDNDHLNTVRHYFIMTGYVFDLNESLKLKPNVLIKTVAGAPVEMDLNANLLIKDRFWVGASWRSFDSINGLFQLQLNEKLQLGYSYDVTTSSQIRSLNSGSHELMVNYRFGATGSNGMSPRYF